MEQKLNIQSNAIEIFPASKRGTANFTSRLYTETNVIRPIVLQYYKPDRGNVILSYRSPEDGVGEIEFCIRGYYFHIKQDETTGKSGDIFNIINIMSKINSGPGPVDPYNTMDPTTKEYPSLWIGFTKDEINTQISGGKSISNIFEMNCQDEGDTTDINNQSFVGLYYDTKPLSAKYFQIELLIPNPIVDDDGKILVGQPWHIFNPALCIDSAINGDWGTTSSQRFIIDMNRPYFVSDGAYAISDRADKQKIWIDNVHYVPHICVNDYDVRKSDIENLYQMWMPLGAVYKSAYSTGLPDSI